MSEARGRLLDTATRLFYTEGVHTVGIDRIIAEAGIAKATFYHHFKSKDQLVVAYLTAEFERQREAFEAVPGAGLEQIGIFTVLGEASTAPGFRGCPFLNAAVEFADPEHPVRAVVAEYREWFRVLMLTRLKDAGHPDPEPVATFLLLLRDGMTLSGCLGDLVTVRTSVDLAQSALVHSVCLGRGPRNTVPARSVPGVRGAGLDLRYRPAGEAAGPQERFGGSPAGIRAPGPAGMIRVQGVRTRPSRPTGKVAVRWA
jgi:AcrR family transcriptional regulator